MQTGEIVNAALDVFAERGWCKRHLVDDEGRVCAQGAVAVVMDEFHCPKGVWSFLTDPTYCAVMLALDQHIPEEFKTYRRRTGLYLDGLEAASGRVADYNNADGVTFTDIQEWFAKTAADEGYVP
jgi:hypothetical protein